MPATDMARALAAFPEALAVAGAMLEAWGAGRRQFDLGPARVEVIAGDARDGLPGWDGQADAWYLDETGIEGDPRPRRRWAQKGEKIRLPYEGTHIRMSATGTVCPRTGEFYALMFSHSDTEIFQIFVDHANEDICFERKRNLLIMDNASWHKSKSIRWGRFQPVFLPPYSPDLNPIERLWLLMKAEWFPGFFAKTRNDLIDRLCDALNWVTDRKLQNKKTCANRKKL